MGPKLMNCCKTGASWAPKEKGKMLKRIQVLEDGGVPAKEARSWCIEGQRRMTGKEYQWLLNRFEMEGFMAHKGLWNLAGEEMLRDRGALPKEECDFIREHRTMHEENILSSWLREEETEKEEVILETGKETEEERVKRGEEKRRKKRTKREVLNEGLSVLFLWRVFDIFSQGEIWRVVVIFVGKTFLRSLSTCLTVSLRFGWRCLW